MKIIQGVGLLLVLLLTACDGPADGKSTLTVMAAASLTEPFTRLGEAYTQMHPEVELVFNFAGSQTLANQIRQGAAADLFASANENYMQVMQAEGFVQVGTERKFVTNQLVVILPKDNPAKVHDIQDLASSNLKLVLASEAVPVGSYTAQFLSLAGAAFGNQYQQQVLNNVVSYEDNVKAVLTKVRLGEADAGLVYASDAASAGQAIRMIPIPDELNVQADYVIAPLTQAAQPQIAQDFITFVESAPGQEILAGFGFDAATR